MELLPKQSGSLLTACRCRMVYWKGFLSGYGDRKPHLDVSHDHRHINHAFRMHLEMRRKKNMLMFMEMNYDIMSIYNIII